MAKNLRFVFYPKIQNPIPKLSPNIPYTTKNWFQVKKRKHNSEWEWEWENCCSYTQPYRLYFLLFSDIENFGKRFGQNHPS